MGPIFPPYHVKENPFMLQMRAECTIVNGEFLFP